MTDPHESQIRQVLSNRIDTVRGVDSSQGEVPVTSPMIGRPPTGPLTGSNPRPDKHYVPPMTTSANTVINAIEARRPGLSDTKRNLLLFFCQGHQLAHSGDALFADALFATDRGVELDDTGSTEAGGPLSPGQLNTVGDALERYGDLTPSDLRTLVQASVPWQLAIKSTLGPRIEWAWLRDWFRRPDETNDPEDDRPTQAKVAAWRSRRATT
jgi:hypothetical protein